MVEDDVRHPVCRPCPKHRTQIQGAVMLYRQQVPSGHNPKGEKFYPKIIKIFVCLHILSRIAHFRSQIVEKQYSYIQYKFNTYVRIT